MNPFSISLAQIQIEYGRPLDNLRRAAGLIGDAAHSTSQLVLFPELWTTGYDLSEGHMHAAANLEVLSEIRRLARLEQITVGGSYLLENAGGIYNTFVLTHPSGLEQRYSKIHLFRLMDEDTWLQPGQAIQSAEFKWGKAGLAICYDLRFPELFRQHMLSGAIMALLVAEWPARRVHHWRTLLRARAIENQQALAAVNAVGQCGGETFAGCSVLLDPWGEALVEGAADREELLSGTLDLDQVLRVRQTIPALTDRRPDLYGETPPGLPYNTESESL